jgi:steroid 5-alpha reductase family enzyme
VLTLFLLDTVIMVVVFGVMWAVCTRVRNYGFLDVTWTFSIGLLALIDGVAGTGDVTRRVLFTCTSVFWSVRLGSFVLLRVLRHHPTEDKRYRTLRERWGSPGAFLAFFEIQALVAAVFSVPFLSAAYADKAHLAVSEWLGLAICAAAIVGEATADMQAAAFKRAAPETTTRVLDVGMWRYSRHPNYFFEMLVWVGLALAALSLPFGWTALACPALIAYFLLRVTGIPLTEKHSIETHGEAYRDYQRRTSAFIPWPPKTPAVQSAGRP